ncbi:MAG: hypothetical protein WEB06_03225 [Actinomycetota bacterium]
MRREVGSLFSSSVVLRALSPQLHRRMAIWGIISSLLLIAAAPPSATAAVPGASALGMEIVGSNDLGGRGFNGDVWVHKRAAYVGQWGFGRTDGPRHCPSGSATGVRVVDVSDPADPRVIATLQNPAGTSAEDMQVITYTGGPAAGRDIAFVGIQACERVSDAPRGLQIFDVTDPAHPSEIGFLSTPAVFGVHEFWVTPRSDGRVIGILAVPFSMLRDDQNPKRGDVRIVDLSDPAYPVELSDWSSNREGLTSNAPFEGMGCTVLTYGHAATTNAAGTIAYVAHWDLGTVILDITDPAAPRYLGKTPYPANAEGDGHSGDLTGDERYLLHTDEVLPPTGACPGANLQLEKGWGYVRVFDVSDPARPIQVGQYKTPNSQSPSNFRSGDYTAHNPVVVGNKAYVSWYSDGVRVLDISDPTRPLEIAHLVPPPAKDPHHVVGYVTEIWGVVVDDRGCVFLSDMNFGLYIVRETSNPACA